MSRPSLPSGPSYAWRRDFRTEFDSRACWWLHDLSANRSAFREYCSLEPFGAPGGARAQAERSVTHGRDACKCLQLMHSSLH